MIKILVLEDNPDSLKSLEDMIGRVSSKIKVFGVKSGEEAEELLKSVSGFHLFLLDINLNTQNVEDAQGMEFARHIREIHEYEFTPIVFITSILSMELASYREIQCYRFITKPFSEEEVKSIVIRVLSHTDEEEKAFILIKRDGINYKVLCDSIVYIEAVPRGVKLHLTEEEVEVKYLSLRQILPKLSQKDFFQCHRMFIVNRRYVEYIDLVNQVIKMLGTKAMVEIGVTYKSRIRSWMNE